MTAAHDVSSALNAQRERSRAQVARYHEIRAALEQLRVTATSTDRSVTVELAAGGAIVDLRLTQQAMGKTPDALSSAILEAIRSGLAKVAEQTAARVEPLTGRRVDVSAVSAGRLPALGSATAAESAGDHSDPSVPVSVPSAPSVASNARFVPEEE